MSDRIRILILTASNLRTSTGSANTVLSLLDNLSTDKYRIDIGFLDDLIPERLKISLEEFKKDPTYVPFEKIRYHEKVSGIHNLKSMNLDQVQKLFDIAIVAIYNEFGEDGKTLGFLELAGIPYLSPKLNSTVIAFDKEFTKAILKNKNILIPKSIEINRASQFEKIQKIAEKDILYPLIVKPTANGASRGTTLVKNSSDLSEAIKRAFNFSHEVLLEQYIEGQEFTVGVTGDYTNPSALPAVMIKPKNEFFDYEAKYVKGYAEEVCPAPINAKLEKELRETAIRAYQAIKAENHSRVDMIEKNGKIYVLEINSFPGLLSSSLFPKELRAAGTSLAEFLDESIKDKLTKRTTVKQ